MVSWKSSIVLLIAIVSHVEMFGFESIGVSDDFIFPRTGTVLSSKICSLGGVLTPVYPSVRLSHLGERLKQTQFSYPSINQSINQGFNQGFIEDMLDRKIDETIRIGNMELK